MQAYAFCTVVWVSCFNCPFIHVCVSNNIVPACMHAVLCAPESRSAPQQSVARSRQQPFATAAWLIGEQHTRGAVYNRTSRMRVACIYSICQEVEHLLAGTGVLAPGLWFPSMAPDPDCWFVFVLRVGSVFPAVVVSAEWHSQLCFLPLLTAMTAALPDNRSSTCD